MSSAASCPRQLLLGPSLHSQRHLLYVVAGNWIILTQQLCIVGDGNGMANQCEPSAYAGTYVGEHLVFSAAAQRQACDCVQKRHVNAEAATHLPARCGSFSLRSVRPDSASVTANSGPYFPDSIAPVQVRPDSVNRVCRPTGTGVVVSQSGVRSR